jgi:hypothetical protein
MKPNWPRWKLVLTIGGVLAAVSFLGALFLALSGKPEHWITLALASALIVIVVLRFVRWDPPER